MIVMVDLQTALTRYREYLFGADRNDMTDTTLICTALEFISFPEDTVAGNVTLGWSKTLKSSGYDAASTALHCRGMLWFINDLHFILHRVGIMGTGYQFRVICNNSFGTTMEVYYE